jgi:glycosyltransferase involved in cell wall biosynthesis
VREQLDNKGFIVPVGDSAALGRTIRKIFVDYTRALEWSLAVAVSARKRYSVDAMVDAHLALYERVLRSPPRRLTECD